jgi:hypothetical protein
MPRSRFYTSNPTPSGVPQGTMGGPAPAAGARPGTRSVNVGDEMYLWVLVFLEVGTMCFMRNKFRRHHGG